MQLNINQYDTFLMRDGLLKQIKMEIPSLLILLFKISERGFLSYNIIVEYLKGGL